MQKRHLDRQQYFNEQSESTKKYVIPYIQEGIRKSCNISLGEGCRVLEVGCGEGGNLLPFLEMGCQCYGVELSKVNYENALKFYEENPLKHQLFLLRKNIYDVTPDELGGLFDIIFLRDVIEHIPAQEEFMKHLKKFISPNGVLFFAFPPWRMPFGGHQQIIRKKWVSMLPYMHVLPRFLYRLVLKTLGVSEGEIQDLLNLEETGISINRFEKIIDRENYKIIQKTHWLFNPNYQIKFGLKPRHVSKIFRIPYLQDFYTTAMYYLLKVEKTGAIVDC